MNRSEKKDFVQKLKEELDSSSSVIVAHYSGITVDETEKLRKEMRDNGAKFIDKNALLLIADLKIGDKITVPGDRITKAIRNLCDPRSTIFP